MAKDREAKKAKVADMTDPRRLKPITIAWDGMIGRITIDGEHWGAVEWSEKRQAWCIEDVEGRCLRHYASIHGEDKNKDGAVALAEAMIRDGRMPTPEQARQDRREHIKRNRAKRAKQPAEIAKRAIRDERDRLLSVHLSHAHTHWTESWAEMIAEAFNLSDPELWRSNSFAQMRPRMIADIKAVIARLEYERHKDAHPVKPFSLYHKTEVLLPSSNIARERRLNRAREILALLNA
jgi:hypothetical protein